jgi:hypothetical protein
MAVHPGPVQHELAVAFDQVLLDLGVAAALAHQRQHLAAHVLGDLRVGVGQRLVLAHHAAQLGGQGVEAGFLGGVAEARWCLVAGGLGEGGRRLRQGQRRGQQQARRAGGHGAHRPRSTCSSAGSRRSATTCSVSGPVCFQRTTPAPSTRKVSGAPATPQSST